MLFAKRYLIEAHQCTTALQIVLFRCIGGRGCGVSPHIAPRILDDGEGIAGGWARRWRGMHKGMERYRSSLNNFAELIKKAPTAGRNAMGAP
jgi:hypothetical protein